MAKRILVAGDSFAAEWPTGKGWFTNLQKIML